ncbi:hypothetical protein H9Q70_000116 [Fusarium xylarioides]|nr:hypothetical protein H9Q70_000116 [Fusarium xylarioides]KAG5786186.1 hypothetical protein H9Q73_000126 [Fusarium xylarioides]
MNAIFNFLSSPLKQPAERPPPSSMPLTASRPSLSPREQRLAKRAADRFSEPAGRSPRSRLSNVSLVSDDNTAEISVVSRRRETIAMAPPLSVKKRITTSTRSSPIHKPKSNGSRVASSPAVRSSPRGRKSVELGSPALIATSPASIPQRVSRVATSSPAVRSSPRRRELAELGGSPAFASSPASSQRGINGVSRTSAEAKSPRKSTRGSRVTTEPQANTLKAQKEKKKSEEQPEEPHFEEEEEEAEAQDDERYEFVRITDHRWAENGNENEIELLMQWKDGETSWISEELLHTDNRQALIEYWRSQPGGRPKNPDDEEVYQVFAIRKHRVRNGVPQVQVEWLGYDTSENTWEDQDSIEEAAPKLVDAYFDQVKGKAKIQATAKSQTKGKPKSKAKAKAPAKTKAQAKTSTRGVTRSSARVSKR